MYLAAVHVRGLHLVFDTRGHVALAGDVDAVGVGPVDGRPAWLVLLVEDGDDLLELGGGGLGGERGVRMGSGRRRGRGRFLR